MTIAIPDPQATANAMKVLAPAFDAVDAVYLQQLAHVAATEPWATDKIKALAFALKVSQGVRSHIAAVIAGGDIEAANEAYTRQIEKLSPERRRILGL